MCFSHENNVVLSGLRENIILTNYILTTDGTNGYAKGDTWCQRGILQPPVQDHSYQCCWCNTSCVVPSPLCGRGRCWPIVVWQLRVRCFLRWGPGVFSRTSWYMWGSWNLPIHLLRNGSLTLMYMVSFMALVLLCTSLPTMEITL